MNPSSSLVSVIMPTYNHGSFIAESIRSVLAQSHVSWELIIIDNYSKDKTEEIVRSFKDPRIHYLKFSNNGIIAASRNRGIAEAKGKYLAYLDSDDLWLPDKLETQVAVLDAHADTYLVYCEIIKKPSEELNSPEKTILKDFSNVRLWRAPKTQNIFLELFESTNFIPIMTVLMRNDNQYHFDENPNLIAVEDYDLWLTITRDQKITYLPKITGLYRSHAFNLSRNRTAYLKRMLSISKKYSGQVPFRSLFFKLASVGKLALLHFLTRKEEALR